jgi:hypothetical protein
MASDLEQQVRSVLGISRPGAPGFMLGKDSWERQVRAAFGEAFLLGHASRTYPERALEEAVTQALAIVDKTLPLELHGDRSQVQDRLGHRREAFRLTLTLLSAGISNDEGGDRDGA